MLLYKLVCCIIFMSIHNKTLKTQTNLWIEPRVRIKFLEHLLCWEDDIFDEGLLRKLVLQS